MLRGQSPLKWPGYIWETQLYAAFDCKLQKLNLPNLSPEMIYSKDLGWFKEPPVGPESHGQKGSSQPQYAQRHVVGLIPGRPHCSADTSILGHQLYRHGTASIPTTTATISAAGTPTFGQHIPQRPSSFAFASSGRTHLLGGGKSRTCLLDAREAGTMNCYFQLLYLKATSASSNMGLVV